MLGPNLSKKCKSGPSTSYFTVSHRCTIDFRVHWSVDRWCMGWMGSSMHGPRHWEQGASQNEVRALRSENGPKKKSHHVALLSSFPFSSSFDVCQKDRKGKCERIAPTWWLFLGGFLLGGVVVLVVVSGRGMHMHMHVHMIIWLNHKSPELGLNLSGS